MRRIVLASTSPYRQAQLAQLGVPFEICPSGVDETLFKQAASRADQLAVELARAKAQAIASKYPDAVIVGGDQVVEIDGEILEKPGHREAAIAQLKRLQGRSHHLHSAIAVEDPSHQFGHATCTTHVMTMRSLLDAQIAAYVDIDTPFDCVGSYRVEALGISLFSSIQGTDHTAIVGMPLLQLVQLFATVGVTIPPLQAPSP